MIINENSLMRNLIENFASQLKESLDIAEKVTLKNNNSFTNIVISGLGGSGIGGEIAKSWSNYYGTKPIYVNHNYELPHFVDNQTLVILCSYSGNTEETLNAFLEARKKDAKIIGITSGGKLVDFLREQANDLIIVPGGLPPRAALAYPLVQVISVLVQLGAMNQEVLTRIKLFANQLPSYQKELMNQAKELVTASKGKTILLYGEEKLDCVLRRACQQINENGKELSFYNVIPEMNHNEIVGWSRKYDSFYTLIFRTPIEYDRNKKRLDITTRIISEKTDQLKVINASGEDLITITLNLIHLLDWLSYYIAEEKKIDVIEVEAIEGLKKELVL